MEGATLCAFLPSGTDAGSRQRTPDTYTNTNTNTYTDTSTYTYTYTYAYACAVGLLGLALRAPSSLCLCAVHFLSLTLLCDVKLNASGAAAACPIAIGPLDPEMRGGRTA
ncbi:hypothetical protein PMIN04_007197 [Paraphaeosphaeria minitans]